MDKALIVTTEYFPPVSTMVLAARCDGIMIEAHENYQKKSNRNRATILGPNGIETLSVPLAKGKNNRQPIQEVAISYETNWMANHLHAIRTAYGNAPYFEHYYPIVEDILLSDCVYLYELNRKLLDMILKNIGLMVNLSETEEYEIEYNHPIIDIRRPVNRTHHTKDLAYRSYHQVFEDRHPFVADLSSLDLLMCTGPESILYLGR